MVVAGEALATTIMQQGQRFFLLSQVKPFLSSKVNMSTLTIKKHLQKLKNLCRRIATDAQVAAFKANGALKPQARSSNCEMISQHTLVTLMKRLGADKRIIDDVRACVPAITGCNATAAAGNHGAAAGIGGSNGGVDGAHNGRGGGGGVATQQLQALPATLPPCTVDEHWLQKHRRYGLTTTAAGKKLHRQLIPLFGLFKAFNTQDIRLDRGRHAPLADGDSWNSCQEKMNCFLGFCFHIMGIADPNLHCYLQGALFAAYLSFLRERQVGVALLQQHCDMASRVLAFLQSANSSMVTGVQRQFAVQLREWVQRFRQQLNNLPPPIKRKDLDPVALAAAGQWLDAAQLCARIMALYAAAANIISRLTANPKGPLTREEAVQLHNTLLSCLQFAFGFPLRVSIAISATTSTYKGVCLHAGCSRRGCPGNHLEWDESVQRFLITAYHHKNSRRWRGTPIVIPVARELESLVRMHVTRVLPLLARDGDDPSPTLLVNPHSGQPLTYASYGAIWRQFALYGTGASFSPQICR